MGWYGEMTASEREGWDDSGDEWDTVQTVDLRAEERAHANSLDEDELEDMLFDGDVTTADGCSVEPDGRCPHGYRSPMLVLGLI
jgi:hypothetical protein